MTNRDLIIKTLDIVEEGLRTDLSVCELARKSGYSLYHFIRLFEGVTGYSPKDYLLQRKLTEAAKELLRNDRKIVDIAFDYQFGSHEAFSRAFRRVFGKSPGEFRKEGVSRDAYFLEPMNIDFIRKISVQKYQEPELTEFGPVFLIGIISYVEENPRIITELWRRLESTKNTITSRLLPERFFQLSFWSDEVMETGFFCMAAFETYDLSEIPLSLSGKIIPRTKYLKFTHSGLSSRVVETYEFIYKHWLPNTDYRLTLPYNLEFYGEKFLGPFHPESESEVYIPILNQK